MRCGDNGERRKIHEERISAANSIVILLLEITYFFNQKIVVNFYKNSIGAHSRIEIRGDSLSELLASDLNGMKKGVPTPLNGEVHYPLAIVLYSPGIFIAVVSAALIAFSTFFSFRNNISWNRNSDNATRFLMMNSEMIRNGTYIYTENSTYGVISTSVIDPWLERMENGMNRYNFGRTFNNFCWKRQDTATDQFPSIFRASQLFATVQVPLRAVFLMSITYRCFLLYATLYNRSLRRPGLLMKSSALLMSIHELLHIFALFIVFSFHVWQDSNYPRTLNVAITTVLVSFIIKMSSLILLKGRSIVSLIRIIFLIATLLICPIMTKNVWSYTDRVMCDQMVPLSTAFAEYAFLMMEFASYLLDINDSKTVAIVSHCNIEDFKTYDATF
ncbi:hypothetical protein RB195_020147 [Necator americanus]|uniref:Uncharacterized protein n=1 Tax=Necator americanus TaxID=51031 RepID=A0ABR1CHG7_NECAM